MANPMDVEPGQVDGPFLRAALTGVMAREGLNPNRVSMQTGVRHEVISRLIRVGEVPCEADALRLGAFMRLPADKIILPPVPVAKRAGEPAEASAA